MPEIITKSTLESHLRPLESALRDLIESTKEYRRNTDRDTREMKKDTEALKEEMKEFKDEMQEFKEEMREDSRLFKEEMRNDRKEMKEDSRLFKEEMRNDRKEMNKHWGALANKMGTVIEDLIVPGVKSVISKYFEEEIVDFSVNRKKKAKDIQGEFDVIAASKSSVYLVETKTSPNEEKLEEFKNKMLRFRSLFPEFNHLKLVPIFATIRFEDDFIPKVTDSGFYAMAYRDWEYMDILNFDEINKMS